MDFEVKYSHMERLIHRLAFASPRVQLSAEDIESSMFRQRYQDVPIEKPVFLTSLPRAGTTVVLEILHDLPELACTIYRDMPFVLAPLLWSRISGGFQKAGSRRERAHGDGLEVEYDSPEGFEEVFWKAFWPNHYREDSIQTWTKEDAITEATEFLRRHMQKIIALRRPSRPGARYLSKNNANIARLPLLQCMCPDALFLVILRDPLEHAGSLHRQHLNFVAQQSADHFVVRYMSDIGHYEFGTMHRPIDFVNDNRAAMNGFKTSDQNYWLAYWISAFEEIERAESTLGNQMVLVQYEALCAEGTKVAREMCRRLGLRTGEELERACGTLRPVRFRTDAATYDARLVEMGRALHERLISRAMRP